MPPRTREELLSYSVPAPELLAEIEKNPLRDPQPSDPYYDYKDTHAGQRAHRAACLREKHHLRYLPGPIPDQVAEEDRRIPVRDGAEITVRIYRPVEGKGGERDEKEETHKPRPLIVMYHEGAFSMGDLSDEEVNCRLFSRDLGAVCVNVDYRLAPEYLFPTWINDSWDALQWVAKNATSLGADPRSAGFIIGGGSAGGSITAVLAHLARDEQLDPPLTGQYLCVPAITCLLNPSRIPERYRGEYLSHPTLTPNRDPVLRMGAGWPDADDANGEGVLRTTRADPESPLLAPLLFPSHAGLPRRAYLQVGGIDPLRDEALLYERLLREECATDTRLDLYPGYGHYFWTNFPRLDMSRRFVEDTVKGVRWLLEGGGTAPKA